MKILTDREYQDLLALKKPSHQEELDKQRKQHQEELDQVNRRMQRLSEDHAIALERSEAKQDLVIQKATKELRDKNQTLTIEKSSAEKEAAMLKKAFENLGFDVKDMKDILNKLVDGVVSKNTIQLVK